MKKRTKGSDKDETPLETTEGVEELRKPRAREPFEVAARYTDPAKFHMTQDPTIWVRGAPQRGAIILTFPLNRGQTKPSDEVMSILQSNRKDPYGNETCLRFLNGIAHYGRAWVLPDTVEGRDLANRIKQQLLDIGVVEGHQDLSI